MTGKSSGLTQASIQILAIAWISTAWPLAFASPPEIVKVRVPAEKVDKWFPPGEELTSMTPAAFDQLVEEAARGDARRQPPEAPGLSRAKHFARWEGSTLQGRSELWMAPDSGATGEVLLEPWTPAVVVAPGEVSPFRTAATGGASVRVTGKQSTPLTIPWRARARPGSRGRRFSLGLGSAVVSSLQLELPKGYEPEGPTGLRQGPAPGSPGFSVWTFLGGGPLQDLRIFRPEGEESSPDAPRLWVSSSTRIETGESLARWESDWEITRGPISPRRFTVDLDPGLELISVTGPAVEEVESFPAPEVPPPNVGVTRVSVRLSPPESTGGESGPQRPTRLRFLGLIKIPSEGSWPLPCAVPVDAVWTGGLTSVRLDPGRVLSGIVPRNGQRVPSKLPADPNERVLTFESQRPGTVAELLLKRPSANVATEVRGRLLVGNSTPSLEARLSWRIHGGRVQNVAFDLPMTWTADRVEVEGVDAPVSWHPEPLPGGGKRVHVSSPSGGWSDRLISLNIGATATVAGGRGPLALPRVRPVGAQVTDELWVAFSEQSIGLRPIETRGLAWLDPDAIPPEPVNPIESNHRIPSEISRESRPVLAWRWVADDAEARVDRERPSPSSRGSIHLVATLDGQRLRVDGRIAFQFPDGVPDSIILGTDAPLEPESGWRFFEEATGQELPQRALDEAVRIQEGIAGAGPAWRVDLSEVRQPSLSIIAHYHSATWRGQGKIPLLFPRESSPFQGAVVVRASRAMRTSLISNGVRLLDPEITLRAFNSRPGGSTPWESDRDAEGVPTGLAHAFEYGATTDSAEIRTETLLPAPGDGVIRDATLTTRVNPGTPSRNLLSLCVFPDRTTSLGVILPAGCSLERVLRDGRPETATRFGERLAIPLGDSTSAGSPFGRGLVNVLLEYRGPASRDQGSMELSPDLPILSLPCLSVTWQLDLPEHWRVSEWGSALARADATSTAPSLLEAIIAKLRRRLVGDPIASAVLGLSTEDARRLDDRAGVGGGEELNLGDWFLRWDAGERPVVIDRDALASSGWGPRSRVNASSKTQPILDALRSTGLATLRVGAIVLVTTRGEALAWAPPGRSADGLSRAMIEATAWGADRSDRFQSATRWREEPSPRVGRVASHVEEGLSAGSARSLERFVMAGQPVSGVSVSLVDRRAEAARGWISGLGVLAVGLWARRFSASTRAWSTTMALGLGLLGMGMAPSGWQSTFRGFAGGALSLICLTRGTSLPRFRWPKIRRKLGGSRRRRTTVGSPRALAIFSLTLLTAGAAVAQPDGLAPILAVLPYEGPVDLGRPPERVLLRLSDHERLRSMADLPSRPPGEATRASRVVHRIDWTGDNAILVTSEFDLVLPGPSGGSWTFPVELSRSISADLDGQEIPVRISEGGTLGTVLIGPVAREATVSRRLRVRRTVTPITRESEKRISLPINPSAMAEVVVSDDPQGGVGSIVGMPAEAMPNGKKGVRLGPVSRLDARWNRPGREAGATASGTVEALYLWDALPAGDRLTARLTYRAAGGTTTVRVGIDPNALVKESKLPEGSEVVWEGTREKPEWVARFDQPIPDGTTILLDLWRPSADARPLSPRARSVPRAEPIGTERFSGSLAFRRPSDWKGRISGGPIQEQLGEEAFVRSWGNLPNDPLTLSGAIRLSVAPGRSPTLALETGPPLIRPRVESSTRLLLSPGRIDVETESTLRTLEGDLSAAEVSFPEGFEVVEVLGDGLSVWEALPTGSIRMRFDGSRSSSRTVKLRGWWPLPDTSASLPRPETLAAIPWPRWNGIEELGGTLTVNSTFPVEVLNRDGGVLEEPGPTAEAAILGEAAPRSYRIPRPAELGGLRWDAPPPRVLVRVESQLTIDPESAEWLAVIRYDVGGGPLDAIHLSLPAEWARNAKLRLPAQSFRRIVETRAETTRWTIHPEQPIWGSQTLTLRSTISLQPGIPLAFPDITARGKGSVETSLRVVNATNQAISTIASSGLQAVAPSSSRIDIDGVSSPPRGVVTQAYKVLQTGWTLRVQRLGEPTARAFSHSKVDANVSRSDLVLTAGTDGTILGSARYEVPTGSGPFLGVGLNAFSRPLWASVNGVPTRPMLAEGHRWQIALATDRPSRVLLYWLTSVSPKTRQGNRVVTLPTAGRGPSAWTVSAHVPEGSSLLGGSPGLAATRVDRQRIEEAAWWLRRLVDSLQALPSDRTSRTTGENLPGSLVRFGILLRQANRAAAWAPEATSSLREVWMAETRQSEAMLRAELTEALRGRSLESDLDRARRFLGESSRPPSESTEEASPAIEPPHPIRLRPVGRLFSFQGTSPSGTMPGTLLLIPEPGGSMVNVMACIGLGCLGALSAVFASVITQRFRGSAWPGRIVFALTLLLATAGAGPPGLAFGLGLNFLGRSARN